MRKTFLFVTCVALAACSASAERSADGRILLTPEVREDLQNRLSASQCDQSLFGEDASFAAPTTTVTYPGSEHFAFTADLPYNPAWGSSLYASLPYEERVTDQFALIGFGPFGLGEGCGIGYTWTITAEGERPKEDVIREINLSNKSMYPDGQIPPHMMPVLMKLNGHEAIRHVGEGFCTTPSVYIFAPDQTYRLDMSCAGDGDSEEQLEMLGSIVESMTFKDTGDAVINTGDNRSFADDCSQYPLPDTATQTALFNDLKHITVGIPYNPDWKTDGGAQLPASAPFAPGATEFGPAYYGYVSHEAPHCGQVRAYQVLTTQMNADAFVARHEGDEPGITQKIRTQSKGGLRFTLVPPREVVCPVPEIHVDTGNDEHYVFTTSCHALEHLEDPLAELEKIAATAKLR